MKSLLIGCDQLVASTLFKWKQWPAFSFDRAVGILDDTEALVGVALFQNWNTVNVDFSYYGDGTLSLGTCRGLARYGLETFNLQRATTLVPQKRKHHLRTVQKFGFKYEGTMRRYYGSADNVRNTAVRFVMFREQIEKFARVPSKAEKVN